MLLSDTAYWYTLRLLDEPWEWTIPNGLDTSELLDIKTEKFQTKMNSIRKAVSHTSI